MTGHNIQNDSASAIEMAFSFHNFGSYEQARELYCQILKESPHDYNALQLLGVLELECGNYIIAADLIGKAVGIVDSDPSAFNNLGEAYRSLNQLDDAERCYWRAIELDRNYVIAYNNLAVTLHRLKRYQEAEDVCRSALALHPSYADAFNTLGNILVDLSKSDQAEISFRKAIRLSRDYVAPHVNLGILYKNTGRYRESEKAYKTALLLEPKSDDALYNLSILYLLQGKLSKGFDFYEKRREKGDILKSVPPGCYPWQGGRLYGKSLLIITEQGAGDTLMMIRYIKQLIKTRQPGTIGVCCDISMKRVFLECIGVDVVFTNSEQPSSDQFDYYCSMMSLPYLFHTTLSSIPRQIPYIRVTDERRMIWRQKVGALTGLKVGLAWAGNRALDADAKRSIPLIQFAPLFDIPRVHFVSLQKGQDSSQLKRLGWDVIDVMDECEDYLDTASLISHLDLIISVDTSIVHLVGAMGMPAWLLNRYESEWRWMLDRSDSPWYPTIRIFRQKNTSDWNETIQLVADELYALVA